MTPSFKNNALLCYITTARGSLTKDNIIGNVVAFYSSDVIYSAKEEIFGICNERPIKRKATAEFPNASVPNVRDILQLLDQVEGKIALPSFVATHYNSLPPSNFDSLAPVLCSLRDEITTLREEVSQLRKINQEMSSAKVENSCIQHDISDIKLMMRYLSKERGQQKISYSDTAVRGKNSEGPGCSSLKGSPNKSTKHQNEMHPQRFNRTLSVMNDNLTTPNSQPSVISQENVRREAREHLDSPSTSSTTLPLGNDVQEEQIESGGQNAEWQVVRNRKLQRGKRQVNVAGTRKSPSGLSGVERIYDLFVGGCNRDTTVDDIKKYCTSLGIDLKKAELMQTKSEWYSAFKISMKQSDRDMLMKSDSWPQGVFVRKFYKAKLGRDNHNNVQS